MWHLLRGLTHVSPVSFGAVLSLAPSIGADRLHLTGRPASSMPRLCWYCHAETGPVHLCPACSRIQPPAEGGTHFELFGLARCLQIDPAKLEQRFYALSRELHPDRHQTGSPYERELSEDWASALNVAYETLRDPVSRAEYLLTLEGIPLDDRARGGRRAPVELFEELLEMQEDLEALRDPAAAPEVRETVRGRVLETRRHLETELAEDHRRLEALFASWDGLVAGCAPGVTDRAAILEGIRQQLGEQAYLRTTLRDVTKALEMTPVEGPAR